MVAESASIPFQHRPEPHCDSRSPKVVTPVEYGSPASPPQITSREVEMAVCRTCGATIQVPEGWSVGPAVRRHYWEVHADRMQKTRADRKAEATIPAPERMPRQKEG